LGKGGKKRQVPPVVGGKGNGAAERGLSEGKNSIVREKKRSDFFSTYRSKKLLGGKSLMEATKIERSTNSFGERRGPHLYCKRADRPSPGASTGGEGRRKENTLFSWVFCRKGGIPGRLERGETGKGKGEATLTKEKKLV